MGREPFGKIPPRTPEPIVDMSKRTVFLSFSLLITLLILKWMSRRSVSVRAWCMLHGVEEKGTKQREFKALPNTETIGRVWQEESLTKDMFALNTAFTAVHVHTWGEPYATCILLCMHPYVCDHAHMEE